MFRAKLEMPSRRKFIKQAGAAFISIAFSNHLLKFSKYTLMKDNNQYDVIIVGGSYSGLAAGMALGRALKKVLIIDSGKPCNRQTPYSHNFITQDGEKPASIAAKAKQQVEKYDTVTFFDGIATKGFNTASGFKIRTVSGEIFSTKKLIFATGIRDIMPAITGFSECWGISVLHCPYCHGYEVKQEKTGILGNGEYGFEFAKIISNWTKDLTLFTNGTSTLTVEQTHQLEKHRIKIVEKEVAGLKHEHGYIQNIIFKDNTIAEVKAIYTRTPFEQHCSIPESLGCEITVEGYIKTDATQKTTVDGVYACGDNVSRLRTVANAVAMGTASGMFLNKEMIFEGFQ